MTRPKDTLSLVADVGGTNTRVALADGRKLLPETVRKIRNADADSLEAVLADYIARENVDCAAAAVAIAGPVDNGRGTLTNLDWSIDEEILAKVTEAETVSVLNDLQAQAFAVAEILPSNLSIVLPGQLAPKDAPRLVVGIGTGFNAAVTIDTQRGKAVPASECGHITLPVRTEDELRLANFVGEAQGFASIEDVLSGRGVEHVYAWCAHEAGSDIRLSAAEVMSCAEAGTNQLAILAVEIFVGLMGRVTGDLALVHLPFNGVYLIGGVARAMAPHLEHFGFSENFHDKGRFSEFMARFPVFIVEDDFAALTGMANRLSELRQI